MVQPLTATKEELAELFSIVATTSNVLGSKARVVRYASQHGYIRGIAESFRRVELTPKGCTVYATQLLAKDRKQQLNS